MRPSEALLLTTFSGMDGSLPSSGNALAIPPPVSSSAPRSSETITFGALRFLVYWLVSSIASALLFLVLHWGEVSLLIGASGVISALMGSACRFAFPPEEGRIGGPVHLLPLLSVAEALRSGTVRVFILMWFVGNLIFALGIPLLGDIGAVAWEAHIGGFVFGFFLFPLFDPLRRRRARF